MGTRKIGTLGDALRKALSTAAGVGGDFLPTPLADEFIEYVRERNVCRQIFRTVTMTSMTLDFPKILSAAKVYYQSEQAAEATETAFTTGTIRLTAKKLMSQMMVSEELYEDANTDFQIIVRDQFGGAIAEAEEEAMLMGDTAHTAGAGSEAAATDANWFTKDHRLTWDGLVTLAGRVASSAPRVNASGSGMSTAFVREAMFNLGKYGRVMQNLVVFLNPWSVNQLLDDQKLVTVDKYGPNATIHSGEFGKLYGKITIIASNYVPDGYGVMTHVQNPVIGDRRLIKFKSEEVIHYDARRSVISVRLDFKIEHHRALCQIYNLELPSSTS